MKQLFSSEDVKKIKKDTAYSLLTEHPNIMNQGFSIFFHMMSLEQCFQYHMQFPGCKWKSRQAACELDEIFQNRRITRCNWERTHFDEFEIEF